MTEERSFIRAVLDSPDDDGPRLIYSDWLEEQGRRIQCDFIRQQCGNPSQVVFYGFNFAIMVWRRGFIEECRCTQKIWCESGPYLAYYHPIKLLTMNVAAFRHGYEIAEPRPWACYSGYWADRDEGYASEQEAVEAVCKKALDWAKDSHTTQWPEVWVNEMDLLWVEGGPAKRQQSLFLLARPEHPPTRLLASNTYNTALLSEYFVRATI